MLEYLSHPALAEGFISLGQPETPALQSMLLSFARILQANPNFRNDIPSPWPLYPLETLFRKPDSYADATFVHREYSAGTKLLALYCFAFTMGMSERARVQAQDAHIGTPNFDGIHPQGSQVEAMLTLHMEQSKAQEIDAWVMQARESERIGKVWETCQKEQVKFLPGSLANKEDAMDVDEARTPARFSSSDLHPRVVCIGGVLMLRERPSDASSTAWGSRAVEVPSFVESPSCSHTLYDLAIDATFRLPILLSGPASSGKSSILHHLHAQLFPSSHPQGILTIPLGDSTGIDAKSLLGSYINNPTSPGQFIWADGSLTRAVRMGYWVILEDVDKASGEVLSIVKELSRGLRPGKAVGQRPTLGLGNRGKVQAGAGFMLFATRTAEVKLQYSKKALKGKEKANEEPGHDAYLQATDFPEPGFFGWKHWAEVRLPAPAPSDITLITRSLFPRLSAPPLDQILPTLISAYEKLQLMQVEQVSAGGSALGSLMRRASLRDLIKWCKRVDRIVKLNGGSRDPLQNPIEHEQIFLEGLDVFLGALPR